MLEETEKVKEEGRQNNDRDNINEFIMEWNRDYKGSTGSNYQ